MHRHAFHHCFYLLLILTYSIVGLLLAPTYMISAPVYRWLSKGTSQCESFERKGGNQGCRAQLRRFE